MDAMRHHENPNFLSSPRRPRINLRPEVNMDTPKQLRFSDVEVRTKCGKKCGMVERYGKFEGFLL